MKKPAYLVDSSVVIGALHDALSAKATKEDLAAKELFDLHPELVTLVVEPRTAEIEARSFSELLKRRGIRIAPGAAIVSEYVFPSDHIFPTSESTTLLIAEVVKSVFPRSDSQSKKARNRLYDALIIVAGAEHDCLVTQEKSWVTQRGVLEKRCGVRILWPSEAVTTLRKGNLLGGLDQAID